MQRGRRQAAVEITPSPEEKADPLLAALIDHGLAEILEGDAPVRILYVSDPAFLDAFLAEERGWRELSVPPMSMVVFRHEVLTEFSMESLEFIAQEKRGKAP